MELGRGGVESGGGGNVETSESRRIFEEGVCDADGRSVRGTGGGSDGGTTERDEGAPVRVVI